MTERSTLPFVIVGHVDHGKSTLIGRLLFETDSLPEDRIEEVRRAATERGGEMDFAHLLDHLEEERRQGITIDTTQVFFATGKRDYVIIDAPGHVEFVKNMITGASQAQAAILIVDVNQGLQEQSTRHAFILSLLGIEQVIVAVNKMDLAGYRQEPFERAARAAADFLGNLGIRPASIVPISSTEGQNVSAPSSRMSWYRGACLATSLDALPGSRAPEEKALLFPVQDVYRSAGARIIVGRIEAGTCAAGQRIKILPAGAETAVRSVVKYPQGPERARSGECIGIITEQPVPIERGQVICSPGFEPALTDTFAATLIWLAATEMSTRKRLRLRCATQDVACRVQRISRRIDSSSLEVLETEAGSLGNLDVGEVVLRTARPIAVTPFRDVPELGRFVLVENEAICAGGIVSRSASN